ncbi:MAG: NusG domain II-containing protein [Ruminococcus sp.]|nr:NusG domain II-containing protein [Ruminococcus sp.]
MNRKFHFISRCEAIIIGGAAILALLGIIFPKLFQKGEAYAVIECGGVHCEIPLDKDCTRTIEGVNGIFEVKDGKIRITQAECPDKICEKTGFIGTVGQSIICVPEKITVTVKSGGGESADITVG